MASAVLETAECQENQILMILKYNNLSSLCCEFVARNVNQMSMCHIRDCSLLMGYVKCGMRRDGDRCKNFNGFQMNRHSRENV